VNKTLFVSGASSDIGAALIERVAGNYVKTLCHYNRSGERIDALRKKFGDTIVPVQADFMDAGSITAMLDQIAADGIMPDHFVHLAASAGCINVRFAKTDWDCFERETDIAFRSGVMLSHAFLPAMAKKKYGKAVFMLTANLVWEPMKPFAAAYTAAKYGLYGLMKSLASEYAPKFVTVNAVSPSMTDTRFLATPDLVKRANADASPIKRLLTVDDVAPTFEFLLSSGADCVTGQNIAITAGG
jgi:3-oxoacyl-[acyl-carrier protein] reductase